jgi:Peptidase S46
MWTFDNPPLDYFKEAYELDADSAWFAKAQRAALRFGTVCSAAFVSGAGLIMTNHHCARESVTEVQKDGENLLDDGFIADTRGEERAVADLYVDKLIQIRDVTAEIYSRDRMDMPSAARAADRGRRAEALGKRLTAAEQTTDSTRVVEVVGLYNGAQYAAYTYRRYDDVRLVMAPEVKIGFFGGDVDNFTYPRYNLDMSFFRAYDESGDPVQPEHHFEWSTSGAGEGDAVFVVGSPGSTSRLNTVSQLEYLRDDELPVAVRLLDDRGHVLSQYLDDHPDEAEKYKLRNAYFSLQNTRKSMAGQLDGLRSDWLIPRRGAAELDLRKRIAASDSLTGLYRSVFNEITAVQGSKKASAGTAHAFAFFLNPSLSSRIMARAMYGYVYTLLRQRGAPPAQLKEILTEAEEIESWPPELEKEFIAIRLREIEHALGRRDASVRRLLGSSTPEEVAAAIVDSTVLRDSTGFLPLLRKNYLSSKDATVEMIQVIAPLYFTQSQQLESFEERESGLSARLGRARFGVYGNAVPPDATFSLRIADGRVLGYEDGGEGVPAFTTFSGLFDRHFSSEGQEEWALPTRWLDSAEAVDYSTQVNLVSTNDITGGNSGSPLLNEQLEVVGLIFDSNLQALPNEFLYTDQTARAVSVDSRGIMEALLKIYGAEALVAELAGRVAVELAPEPPGGR